MIDQGFSAWFSYAGAIGALLGLVVGSFLNVLIYRLPLMIERQWQEEAASLGYSAPLASDVTYNLALPRSHCPHCQHTLTWWENLPLLSFVLLKGRCLSCHAPIAWRYPAIEWVTACAGAICFYRSGLSGYSLAWLGFMACLLALAVIDWNTTLLPDSLTQPLTWSGMIAAALGLSDVSLSQALTGATAGYLSLWTVYWIFKLLTGKEGMGHGDFKLFAALGAWLGWMALIPIILLASLSGIAVGLVLQNQAKLRDHPYIPFGPFLAFAAAVYWLWGAHFFRWLGM